MRRLFWLIYVPCMVLLVGLFMAVVSGCGSLKVPLASPFRDGTAERWCGVAKEGSAIYGEFVGDLDAEIFVPVAPPPAPPMSNFGDKGSGVYAWQEHLADSGFPPGPIDGRHGPLTDRATEAWLRTGRRAVPLERAVTPWAADYLQAKSVVETKRAGILGLCQGLEKGEPVTVEALLEEGFEPAAEAFGDVVGIHRDVIQSTDYDHDQILDKLRLVQAEAMTIETKE